MCRHLYMSQSAGDVFVSSYVVLARKWRPAQFADIVGQQHIVRTLTNAILSQRIHQAYLFTGSRGIGKTSIARIFAKVIRCENVKEENGALRSCDQCPSCKEITTSASVDVIEIDGASNNGVEAVREIRENAKYMPSQGTRKIYIVDEVHMLTTAAFNALLKTLEEPPPHVIFIFATTEPHKIPATILSRCQRFDYRRVTVSQIQARLIEVTQAEGIEAEPGALALIGRAAEGSMRDALSLLDQVIAFAGNQISVQSVRESVGLVNGQLIIQVLKSVFQKTPLEALELIESAFQQGHDLRVLTRGLIEFLHSVILAKIGSSGNSSTELSQDEWAEIKAISNLRSLEEMEIIFQVLHQGLEWIARSPQPKLVLDVLLIKCATAEALIFVNSVSAGEKKIPASAPQRIEQPQVEAIAKPVPPPVAKAPENIHEPVKVHGSMGSLNGEKTWTGLIESVRKSRPLLASILEHANNSRIPLNDDKALLIYFSQNEAYYREQLNARAYQEQLHQFAKDYFGERVKIQIELKEGESLAARKEREQKEKIQSIREKAQNHPIILEAKSLFGGELSPIEVSLK